MNVLLSYSKQNSISDDGGGSGGSSPPGNDDLTEFGVWSRHSVAGGISAGVSKTITAPLDRIRVHLQVTDCCGYRPSVRFVYASQGLRGFWRGNGLNVLKSSPELAFRFGVYEYTKRQLKNLHADGRLTNGDRFLAGALAGVCSQTVLYPLETVKTRFMMGLYTGIMDVVFNTYKTGGARAFFKGFWLSTLNAFLFTGIDLMTYEHVKYYLSVRLTDETDRTPLVHHWSINLISALCSSTVGVSVCYPISTIITRLQVNDGLTGTTTAEQRKRLATLVEIRCLYRGFFCSFTKMFPTMSISYVIYEELCKTFGVRMS